jgi:hypothetical protein
MNDYRNLYNQALANISSRPIGLFKLNELLDNPPALLGVWLYEDVANNKIANVRWSTKMEVNIYEKV